MKPALTGAFQYAVALEGVASFSPTVNVTKLRREHLGAPAAPRLAATGKYGGWQPRLEEDD
jgi:hypothetical protein